MANVFWRVLPLLIIIMLLAACGDLAGDVEIVATLTPMVSQPMQLPASAPNLASGAAIFQENCTRCHGTGGAGDGELVVSGQVGRMPSFLEPAHVRQQSLESYYNIITNGSIENLMPPWGEALTLQQRWDVAAYVYTLHYTPAQIERGASLVSSPSTTIQTESDNTLVAATGLSGDDAYAAVAYQRMQSFSSTAAEAASPEPEATELPIPTFSTIDFFGTVTHGTAGKTVPPGLSVQLRYGNDAVGVLVMDAVVDANNQYRFTAIPYDVNYEYFVATTYQERGFLSRLVGGRTMQASNELNIVLYDIISEPSVVTMTDIDFQIDALNVPDLGVGIVINQTNAYFNPTDRMFVMRPETSDLWVSVLMQLPVGAVILNSRNDPRFIQSPSDYALIDLQPVYPGEHIVNASYFLPYTSARVIDIPLNNRFEGQVDIMVSIPELSIVSDTFVFVEEVNTGTVEEPQMSKLYSGTITLEVDQSLIFDIEGELPFEPISNFETPVVTEDYLMPVLTVIGIVVLGLGIGLLFGLRARATSPQAKINRLMNQIAQLEDLHKTGRINHDAFQNQVKGLRAELTRLIAEQKKS